MMALVAGRVTVDDAGCVMVDDYPVVWPMGTTFASTDPLRLRFADGRELEQGVEVSGPGGFVKLEALEVTIPSECRSADGDVAVFNPHSELRIGADATSSDEPPPAVDIPPETEPVETTSAPYAACDQPIATTPWGSGGLVEGQPQGEGLEAWVLLWKAPPWPVDAEIKLVVSLTGAGEFTAAAVGPDGLELDPSWGPNHHSDSNFDRPGEEWGLAFAPSVPGCWELVVGRGNGSARFQIDVIPGG
jgi:hypothetical protein